MGFDAIWISPIVQNNDLRTKTHEIDGYHGYWASDFDALNEKFGTESELISLISKAHQMDILVMLDVVANHVGYVDSNPVEIKSVKDKKEYKQIEDFSKIKPFDKAEYYHKMCEIHDWNDIWQLENCRLCGLPDLDQDHEFVKDYLLNWIQKTVQKYKFDGIRIDTLGHVSKEFWAEYAEASGVFQMGECLKNEEDFVAPYQNYVSSVFDVPL